MGSHREAGMEITVVKGCCGGLAIRESYWEQELGGQTPGAQDSLEDTEVRGRVLGEKGAFWAQGLRC